MNTFRLTHSLQGGEPMYLLQAIASSAKSMAKKHGFTYEQGVTVGDYVQICGEWNTLGDLRSVLRFNPYGLQLMKVGVRLDDLILPDPNHPLSISQYRAFEEYGKRLVLYYDSGKQLAAIENDPSRHPWNEAYEAFMLDRVSRVQAVSRAGKAAKTLIMAYRGTDRGYIDRATKQLFEEIGGTL